MLVASSNKSILLCTRLVWKPISRERERKRERERERELIYFLDDTKLKRRIM
jgi:hypothetical protein